MKRILRIGMDVHSTNYTLCAIEPRFDGDDIIYANVKVTPDPDNIVQFIEKLKSKIKNKRRMRYSLRLRGGMSWVFPIPRISKERDTLCDSCPDHNDDAAGEADQNG